MLIRSKLTEYINENDVIWNPDMPKGVPPEDIEIPVDHELYRLTKGLRLVAEDLTTYHENFPNKDWGDRIDMSFAVSLFDDLNKLERLLAIPSLKNSKAVAKLRLNANNGVVKQTTGNKYHYSWWKTIDFDIESGEIVKTL